MDPEQKDPITPIAIVGMSGKFAGEATNLDKLWDMCAAGRDAWTPIPKSRFNSEAFYHPDASRNGSSNVKGGFFFEEDLAKFDAPFFGLTKTEAAALDPEQRLLLECAYETFENAGLTLPELSGSSTGVYIGTFLSDWIELTKRDPDAVPMYQPTGSGHSMLAGRLAYFFNLHGPAMTADTACSASLVALHSACAALRAGDCDRALVGGVTTFLNHDFFHSMSTMRFLSPDGRSYTYDKRANGYARGEGVATLLLKPLAAALRDGDPVRAVIRSTGLNNDGRTPGITFPSGKAQADLIRQVYSRAGLDLDQTSYVETHGTGTQAGDPVEARALWEAFGRESGSSEKLVAGSIKTNIGHVEGASGVTSLVKVVMMLEREMILPNANFGEASDKIPMDEWMLEVPTTLQRWRSTKALRASINNFGYAGTNAHIVIEQTQSYFHSRGLLSNGGIQRCLPFPSRVAQGLGMNGASQNGTTSSSSSISPLIFTLSAHDSDSSATQANLLVSYLEALPPPLTTSPSLLPHLAHTLTKHRTVHPHKRAYIASSIPSLIGALLNPTLRNTSTTTRSPTLGFIFPGQGAQYAQMGLSLLPIPAFADSISASARILSLIGATWSPVEELTRPADTSRINSALLSQPLCTVLQIALVDLLRSWDIVPAAVVGHSSGELAAAYAAGLVSREEAIVAAYHRGIAAKLSNEGMACGGAMAAVAAGEQKVEELIARVPQEAGKVVIACYNSPTSITVSGDETAAEKLVELCVIESISARKLVVDVAYHSERMLPLTERYVTAQRQAIKSLSQDLKSTPLEQICEMFSSVSSKPLRLGDVSPEYWADNLAHPVRFTDAVAAMLTASRKEAQKQATAVDCLVEIGPHSALAGPLRQIMQADTRFSKVSYLSALVRKQDALDTTLSLAANLWEKGYPVDIAAVNSRDASTTDTNSFPRLLTNLPSYPWNHTTSYWAEPRSSIEYRLRKHPRHDLLGAPVQFGNALEPRWRNWLRTSELPWVRDHRVQGLIVYPAAGYFCMAIEAMRQFATDFKEGHGDIEGFTFKEMRIGQALVVPESSQGVETMFTLKPHATSFKDTTTSWYEFAAYSASDEGRWTEHCRGLAATKPRTQVNEIRGERDAVERREWHVAHRATLDKAAASSIPSPELYQIFTSMGLEYGAVFANITAARSGDDLAVGTITVPDVAACMPANYHSPFVVHPGTLDAAFQAAFSMFVADGVRTPMVPTFIQEAYISSTVTQTPGAQLGVFATVEQRRIKDATIDMHVYDDESRGDSGETQVLPVISVSGLTMTSLTGSMAGDSSKVVAPTYHQISWHPDPVLLTSAQFAKMCEGIRMEGLDDETLVLFDQATFYMADHAVEAIRAEAFSGLSGKNLKLYTSLKSLRDAVAAGKHGPSAQKWASSSTAERAAFWAHLGTISAEGRLHLTLRENMHRIILGEVDPLTVAFKDDLLGAYYASNVRMGTQYLQAARYVDVLANQNPHLKILEIGAGTGGATMPLLRTLGGHQGESLARFISYDVTDITTGFFEKLQAKTEPWGNGDGGLVRYSKLDVERDPGEQGYEMGTYDLVVAANVLHATTNMERTMANVCRLLKPGGKLILVELMKDARICTRIFGIFDGWWAGEEPERAYGPLMTEAGWDGVLRNTGFTGLDLEVWDLPNTDVHQGTTMISSRRIDTTPTTHPAVLVVGRPGQPLVDHLKQKMVAQGLQVEVSDGQTLQHRAEQPWLVVSEVGAPLLKDATTSTLESIKRILLGGKTVLWVTQGATAGSTDPDTGMISGLLATLRLESGGALAHLDLDPSTPLASDEGGAAIIARVFQNLTQTALSGIDGGDRDLDFIERNGTVLIPRFTQDNTISRSVASTTNQLTPSLQPIVQPDRHLKLEIEKPGLLDSLYFKDDLRVASLPSGDEVDIQVHATALNFRDIMTAMGQIEQFDLGSESSGTVTRVGPDVKRVKVGDTVVAQASGTFATLVRAAEPFVQRIPADIQIAASTLPIVFTTALYAIKVARLVAGETVLIHSAAGGLGQALVSLCRHLIQDADVFATVGTPEKKRFVMEEFGIKEDRIFSSRDGSFKSSIMRATNGRGVDVIFNSLSGDLLRATWQIAAPFGRFIELGKRDMAVNSRLEMGKFLKNVSFAAVDLGGLIDDKPEVASELMEQAIELVVEGKVKPPKPITTYSMAEVEKAMRIMQSGKHMGKLVLTLTPDEEERFKVMPKKEARAQFRPDATYLLVGGLGGIGRAWATRMVQLGAKTLLFLSPSGGTSSVAIRTLVKLKEMGASVLALPCDVSDKAQLASALSTATQHGLPPIKGLFHLGANFSSDLFKNMDLDTWNAGVRPKVHSTWNLHELLPQDLDFFILVASMAGVLGNTSQGAYSAASSFQDSFADYRNNLGLPAVSIDLGVVAAVGRVAEDTGRLLEALQKNLEVQGVVPVEEEECMAIFEAAVTHPRRNGKSGNVLTGLGKLAAGDLGGAGVNKSGPMSLIRRAGLLSSSGGTSESQGATVRVRDQLKNAASPAEADGIIVQAMIGKIASLLMVPAEEVDASRPMSSQGLDSLVAVELRNWISSDIEVTVAVLELLGNQSLLELCRSLARQSRLVRKELRREDGE